MNSGLFVGRVARFAGGIRTLLSIALVLVILSGAMPLTNPEVLPPTQGRLEARGVVGGGGPEEPPRALTQVAFLDNAGQFAADVRYAYISDRVSIGFGESSFTVGLRSGRGPAFDPGRLSAPARVPREGSWVRVSFVESRSVLPEAVGVLPFRTNFYLGDDLERWREGVHAFEELVYPELYEGVSLRFRVTSDGPKYSFVVAPGADVNAIRARYDGSKGVDVDATGNLVVTTPAGEIRDSAPLSYQGDVRVPCSFVLVGPTTVGFRCHGREPSRTLVIDPLIYSTFVGGSGVDRGWAIAVDAQGSAYVVGESSSSDFPFPGTSHAGNGDAFIVKLNPSGSGLVYATFIGGNGLDIGFGVAVDSGGNGYLTGMTIGPSFPVTPGAFDTTPSGSMDGFASKVSPTGTLVYSTYLGAGFGEMDSGYAIAVDSAGRAVVTGFAEASDFPTTAGAFDRTFNGGWDVFVTKLSADGSSLVFSTFLGSTYTDIGVGIALDALGSAFVVGYTYSPDYPTTPGAFDRTNHGALDVFVTKLSASGAALEYSTFLGGSKEEGNSWFYIVPSGIAVDAAGSAYVAGRSASPDFPTTAGAFDPTYHGTVDAFVTKLDPAGGSLVYSTFLGGASSDGASAIAIDAAGNAYVTGFTESGDFPVTRGAVNSTIVGWWDVFVAKIDPSGGALLHSTLLGSTGSDYGGGIAVDGEGRAYVTGYVHVGDFPTTPGAFDRDYPGYEHDAFVAKLDLPDAPIYRLSIDTSPPGMETEVDGTAAPAPRFVHCEGGTSLAIRAPSPQSAGTSRYVFDSWSDGGAQLHDVVCDASRTYVASFHREIQYLFDTDPGALDLVIDGAVTAGPREYWWRLGSPHSIAVPSPQGTPQAVYRWSSWNDGGPRNRSITANLPASLVAHFEAVYYLTVVSDHGGVSCDSLDCWYAAGAMARVTVVSPVNGAPGTRHGFASWGGDGSGTAGSTSILMDGPKTVVARWTTEHLVTARSPFGNVSGDGWHPSGLTVEVSVSPTDVVEGGRRMRFVEWTGAVRSSSPTLSVVVEGPMELTAVWTDASGLETTPVLLAFPIAVVATLVLALLVWRVRRRKKDAA